MPNGKQAQAAIDGGQLSLDWDSPAEPLYEPRPMLEPAIVSEPALESSGSQTGAALIRGFFETVQNSLAPEPAPIVTAWLYRTDLWPGLGLQGTDAVSVSAVLRGARAALDDLAASKNRRLRERAFDLHAGDPTFGLIGLPAGQPESLVDFLHKRFAAIPGYETSESVDPRAPETRMFVAFRYDHGNIEALVGLD